MPVDTGTYYIHFKYMYLKTLLIEDVHVFYKFTCVYVHMKHTKKFLKKRSDFIEVPVMKDNMATMYTYTCIKKILAIS